MPFNQNLHTYLLKFLNDKSYIESILFQNYSYTTCMAHGLYRVEEKVRPVRGKFSHVDKLISSVEKIFRKAPNRVLR